MRRGKPDASEQEGSGELVAEKGSKESKNVVYSVAKCFRVMEAFTSEMPSLLLSEVARRADVDNATAFRLLNTLVALGYVEKDEGEKRFRLSLKCLDLGFNAIARMDLRQIARPMLHRLVAEGAGAASIGVLDHGDVIYIDRVQPGLTRIVVDIRIGTRIPAFSSALGRAMLAALPPEARRRHLESRERAPLTPYTVTDVDRLMALLDEAQARGYALVDQESVVGLRAIAAPIVGSDGLPIAALSVAAASTAAPSEEFTARYGGAVREVAATLSRAMQAAGGIAGGL
jgi:IclR family pca regulon transcriptional regulator